MTDPETPERTAGGLAGKVAGRAKEAAGSVLGDDELAREGRLQQAQIEAEEEAAKQAAKARAREAEAELKEQKAETEVEREHLRAEVEAKEREEAAERDGRQAAQQADRQARQETAANEAERRARLAGADQTEEKAEAERVSETRSIVQLQREARRAEAKGVQVVMNRCPKIEFGRISGEISWQGINSRMLSSKKPILSGKGFQKLSLNRPH